MEENSDRNKGAVTQAIMCGITAIGFCVTHLCLAWHIANSSVPDTAPFVAGLGIVHGVFFSGLGYAQYKDLMGKAGIEEARKEIKDCEPQR